MNSSLRAGWVVLGFGACGLLSVNGQDYDPQGWEAQKAAANSVAEKLKKMSADEQEVARELFKTMPVPSGMSYFDHCDSILVLWGSDIKRTAERRRAESAAKIAAVEAERRAEIERKAREEARRASERAKRNEALNTVKSRTAEEIRAGRFGAAQEALAAWRAASAGDAEFIRLADTLEAEVKAAAAEHARIRESNALLGSFLGDASVPEGRAGTPLPAAPNSDGGQGTARPTSPASAPAGEPDLLGSFL